MAIDYSNYFSHDGDANSTTPIRLESRRHGVSEAWSFKDSNFPFACGRFEMRMYSGFQVVET